VSIYLCFLLLSFYVIGLALPAGRFLLGKAVGDQHPHVRVALLLALPYLVYSAGTADFRLLGLLRLLAISLPVVLVYRLFPVSHDSPFTGQDIVVACWLVGIVLFQQLRGIWNVPRNLDFMTRLYLVSLGAFTWIYLRPVPLLGYTLTFSKRVGAAATINFLLFTMLAIPAGFALGFLSWNPRWQGTTAFVFDWLELFLFIAILEELFFRGFLQNLLSQSFGSWWRGQLVASCVFGLFHIRHAPFPNWRYVVLASLGGWFYGSAYRQSGTIFGSALVHATVDTMWRTFFTRS
jgi:membrane protease YdiL (CAAX protease family)